MIVIIATIYLAASTANPGTITSHEGRQLTGYTQRIGESCDLVSVCMAGLYCSNSDFFGTGTCVKRGAEAGMLRGWVAGSRQLQAASAAAVAPIGQVIGRKLGISSATNDGSVNNYSGISTANSQGIDITTNGDKTTITRTSTSTRVHSNDRSPMVIAGFAVGCVVLVGAVVVSLVVVHFYEKATEPAPSDSAHPSGGIVRL